MTNRIVGIFSLPLCLGSVVIAEEGGEGPKTKSHARVKAFNAGDAKTLAALCH